MSSPCPRVALLICAVLLGAAFSAAEVKVCADPDALPFSNVRQQGFENRLALMLARELHTRVHYTWERMGHGFVRDILNKSRCDILLGIPVGYRGLLTTEPYYRSSYVFAVRKDSGLRITSFDDPQLRRCRIGVQAVGEEYAPPAQALSRRGLLANLHAANALGPDRDRMLRALLARDIDVAVVWGPQAGYFDQEHGHPFVLTPVQPEVDVPALPMTFMIAMGVRQRDVALRDRLDRFLQRRRVPIQRLLRSYGVPLLPIGSQGIENLLTAKAAQ